MILTMPVGYGKCFEASGVAGKVLIAPWADTRVSEEAAKAMIVERATGDIVKMQGVLYVEEVKKNL